MENGLKPRKIGHRKPRAQVRALIQETDGGGPDLGWRRWEWREGSEVLKEEAEWAGLSSFAALGWGEEWRAQDDSRPPASGTRGHSGVAD